MKERELQLIGIQLGMRERESLMMVKKFLNMVS
jgi:hypothetical protein